MWWQLQQHKQNEIQLQHTTKQIAHHLCFSNGFVADPTKSNKHNLHLQLLSSSLLLFLPMLLTVHVTTYVLTFHHHCSSNPFWVLALNSSLDLLQQQQQDNFLKSKNVFNTIFSPKCILLIWHIISKHVNYFIT